jgi:hypothetical protein
MTSPEDIAVVRIELEDIKPLIWRRVAVRTSMNLNAVHGVIQAAMGWLDYHLWEFATDERRYGICSCRTTLIGMSGSTMPRRLPYPPF